MMPDLLSKIHLRLAETMDSDIIEIGPPGAAHRLSWSKDRGISSPSLTKSTSDAVTEEQVTEAVKERTGHGLSLASKEMFSLLLSEYHSRLPKSSTP